MSTVYIHVGQCGNQLSLPLWKNFLHGTRDKYSSQNFLSLDSFTRSIHIDSEPKVVSSVSKHLKVREDNVVVGRRGRGTNFALGYHGIPSLGDDHVLENSMEAIRKEVERCDMYSGSVVFHSLSGGTGSGLGSHLVECLRDCYPCNYIMSCAVAPCISGESPLQDYNTLLALHWLQTYSDSIAVLHNDSLISHISNLSKDPGSQVSFKDLNRMAADCLSGIFLPTDTLSASMGVSLGQEPWEIVKNLTPAPATKFYGIVHHSSSKLSWEGIVSKALQQHKKYSSNGQRNNSISAIAVARGDKTNSFMHDVNCGLNEKIRKGVNFVEWNPYPLDCWTSKEAMSRGKDLSSVTLAINSSCVRDHFNTVLMRSLLKLKANAYIHWYRRYGLSQDIFEESVETVRCIISEYEAATL